MKSKNLYSIKYVSTCTGLKPHLVRAWESRYQAVVPKRTETNRRLYCQDDIRRLKLLKLAVDQGHQISCIAGLSAAELAELLGETEAVTPSPPRIRHEKENLSEEQYQRVCMKAVVDLEPDQLTHALSDAAVRLTRKQWIEGLMVPLFKEIGDMWASGDLKIVNEHMASNCARIIMWDMLRSVEISASAPKIVIGTPVGQWHELGALAAALASTDVGWRPVYVGANLPAEELASAMERFGAKCIGLSITHSLDDNRIQPELLKLRRYIGPTPSILVGGLSGADWEEVLHQIKAKHVASWQDVTSVLTRISIDRQDPPL